MARVDKGFIDSEKELNKLEKALHKEYAQAAKEMTDKANKYFARFAQEDAKMADKWQKGEITKKQYGEWRQRKMLTGQRWRDMRNVLTTDLVNVDKIAMQAVRGKTLDVFALNLNYGAYALEQSARVNTSWTLYNRDAVINLVKNNPQLLPKYANPKVDIAKDMRWNMQHIQSAVTQSILQGESIPKLADRLQDVTNMDRNAAIRNARTAMNSAQNAGRLESMKQMQARGIENRKVWIAVLDNVTRDSHVDLDGEVRDLDKPFSNGMDYPCGAGEPAEVYNCRCRLGYEFVKYHTDWSDLSIRNTSKFQQETYEQWKHRHDSKPKKVVAAVKEKVAEVKKAITHTAIYQKIVDNIVKSGKIDYRKVEDLQGDLSDTEIISKLSGGDMTGGSCSSLSYAYIGNRCGYDVTDYRGGDSRYFFSRVVNERDIRQLEGIDCQVYKVKKEAGDIAKKLKELDLPKGKEYRLSCGKHAAIIRNTDKGYQYLELQSSGTNGWKYFTEKTTKMWAKNEKGEYYIKEEISPCTMTEKLHDRFGCRKTVDKVRLGYGKDFVLEKEMELTAVDSYKGNEEFKEILGYLNTAPDKQLKGVKGHER